MTLIIAGHDLQIDQWDSFVWGSLAENTEKKEKKLKSEGLFVAADSVITTFTSRGSTPILSEHRKVHPVEIKLWKPYFVDGYFRSYSSVYLQSSCFVAFAGSTLTAYHALNTITDHLGRLRISFKETPNSETGWMRYVVLRHCESNPLTDPNNIIQWIDDGFIDGDFTELLSAEIIANVIEYSINEALSSAQKHRLDQEAYNNMRTDFVAGIHCPASKTHKLFLYRMNSRTGANGTTEAFTIKQEVTQNQVAVLGMRSEFEKRAQTVFDKAVADANPPMKKIFEFLNTAISEVQERGSHEIDWPSILKTFQNGMLKKAQVTREAHIVSEL